MLATGLPSLDAQHDFRRARRSGRIGTIEPGSGFDARFRPTTSLVRSRWERVALAHRTGKTLPPVTLVRRPEGHYVIDGRHRVSVARALKLGDIEAWVRA